MRCPARSAERRVGRLVLGAHEQRLVGVEVGVGEVDLLVALVGDRDRGGDDVAFAGGQRPEDAVERQVEDLELEPFVLGDRPDEIDVVAGLLAVGSLELEGLVRRVRAHLQGRAALVVVVTTTSGGTDREDGGDCEGQGGSAHGASGAWGQESAATSPPR